MNDHEPVIVYNPPYTCPTCERQITWSQTYAEHQRAMHTRPLFPEPRVGGQREEAELRAWQDRQRYGRE